MKCVGSKAGPCPDSRSGLGVCKYGETNWQCEVCHKTDNPETNDANNDDEVVIINELLCYIYNKRQTLDAARLIGICQSFYEPDEIHRAKCELYKATTGSKNENTPRNEHAQSPADELREVIKIISRDATGLPTFVTKNLSRIPTNTNSTNSELTDVASLVRDITLLHRRMDALDKSTRHNFIEVRDDIERLSRTNQRPPPRRTVSMLADYSESITTGDDDEDTSSNPELQRPQADPEPTTRTDGASVQRNDKRWDAWLDDVRDTEPVKDTRSESADTNKYTDGRTYSEALKSNVTDTQQQPVNKPTNSRRDSGINRNMRLIGTSKSKRGLQASAYEKPEELFISHLKPDTREHDLIDYVKRNIGCQIECEKINTSYSEEFASFRVYIRKRSVPNMFNAEIWPVNTTVQFYRAPRRRRGENSRYSKNYDHYNSNKYRSQYSDRNNQYDTDSRDSYYSTY